MIRLPSLQKPFDTYFTGDPALHQPPPAPSSDADDETKAAHKLAMDEYRAKVRAAWDTGNWSALLKPGETPLKFVLGQIDRTTWRALLDRHGLPDTNPRHIGLSALLALLFRLSVRDIVGSDVRVEREPDPQWDGWVMAKADLVTVLDIADERIVTELGAGLYRRLAENGPFGRSS